MVVVYAVGCATLVSGTSVFVRVTSRPSGARVTVQPGQFELRTKPVGVEVGLYALDGERKCE